MAAYQAPQLPFDQANEIIRLLQFLQQFLDELFDSNRPYLELLPAEVGSQLEANYRQQIRGQIDRLIQVVDGEGFRFSERAGNFGLTGASLAAKLSTVQYLNDQLPRNPVLDDIVNDRPRGVRKVLRKGLGNVLDAVDIPLDSLTKLLGVHEAIVEFKKALALLLGLGDD